MQRALQTFLNKIPVPCCCLALGFAGLGQLVQEYNPILLYACGGLATVLWALVALRIFFCRGAWAEMSHDTVSCGALACEAMTLMLLSAYVKPFVPPIAGLMLWGIAVLAHMGILVLFTVRNVMADFSLKKVCGVWLVPYMGISASALTAAVHGVKAMGFWLMLLGGLGAITVFALSFFRYKKDRDTPPPLRPLFCIYCAPFAMCLAAYLQSAPLPSAAVVLVLIMLASLSFFYGLAVVMLLFPKTFFPSQAAFTFPLVINATALKMSAAFLAAHGYAVVWMQALLPVETGIAAFMCVAVFIRFLVFLRP